VTHLFVTFLFPPVHNSCLCTSSDRGFLAGPRACASCLKSFVHIIFPRKVFFSVAVDTYPDLCILLASRSQTACCQGLVSSLLVCPVQHSEGKPSIYVPMQTGTSFYLGHSSGNGTLSQRGLPVPFTMLFLFVIGCQSGPLS